MMFIVSLLYALCWLPLNTLIFLLSRCDTYASHPYIYYIFFFCHFTAMSHSMVNPIVYFLSYERFREGFQYVFKFLPWVAYKPKELVQRGTTVKSSRSDMSRKDRLTSINSEHSRLLSYGERAESALTNGNTKKNSVTPELTTTKTNPNGTSAPCTTRRHIVTINGETVAAIEGDKESLC